MKEVDPIRDKKKIDALKVYLKGISLRYYALFILFKQILEERIEDEIDMKVIQEYEEKVKKWIR